MGIVPKLAVEGENLVARIGADNIQAMFYLFSGKPDSTMKTFTGLIQVGIEDVFELDDKFQEKFQHFNIANGTITVTVVFRNDKVLEFGSWKVFKEYRWDTASETGSLKVKWDFLVDMPQYSIAQRHTAVVNMSMYPSPMNFLEISSTPTGMLTIQGDLDLEAAISCRVDYINSLLGEELIQIVSNWHSTRRRAPVNSWVRLLKKHKVIIRFVLKHITLILTSIPVSIKCVKYFQEVDYSKPLTAGDFWIGLALVAFLYTISKGLIFIGSKLVYFTYKIINSMPPYRLFLLTSGDKNAFADEDRDKDKRGKHVTLSLAVSFIVNLIAGFIVYFVAEELLK